MTVGSDWAIDYINFRVYHNTGTEVFTVNALYSWIQDTFDEIAQMDNSVPMSAQTPTNYTMINGWFMDDTSVKFLRGGAIETSGYNGAIQVATFSATSYENVAASDIGLAVHSAAETNYGNLLAFNNTTRKWWVRGTTPLPTATIYHIDGGTAVTDTTLAESLTGEDLYANIYTLGTIETLPGPQIYIFQGGSVLAEWSYLSNWKRGHIDVLIKVKEADVELSGAIITLYARQPGDLYDNYEIGLSSGGRNAAPLSTSDDLNEDTGDYYLACDNIAVATFTNNEVIQKSGFWSAELMAITTTSTTYGVITMRGLNGTVTDNDAFTGLSSATTADTVGTQGDTLIHYYSSAVNFSTLGQSITGSSSFAKRLLRGFLDYGDNGQLVCQVDTTQIGSAFKPQCITYSNGETLAGASEGNGICSGASITKIAGWKDVIITFVNGTVTTGAITGTYIPGEVVRFSGTGGDAKDNGTAILLAGTASPLTLGNVTSTSGAAATMINGIPIVGDLSGATATATAGLTSTYFMNKNFEQQTAKPYSVIIQAGSIYVAGRTLANVYEYFKFVTQENSVYKMYTVAESVITPLDGEEYIIASSGYVPVKSAPFGTFAGGKYFGAQGVWVEGMAASQSYQFTDKSGTIQAPYTSVTISVTSLVSGDRVSVFRTTAGTTINDAMYTSDSSANTVGDQTFVVIEALATDTPSAGVIRFDDAATNTGYRVRYTSWTTSTFTLASQLAISAASGTNTTTISCTGTPFATTLIGDVIRNTTNPGVSYVAGISGSTQVTVDPAITAQASGDVFEINTVPVTTSSTTTIYVPFIDKQSTADSATQSVLYTADRTVLIRVRKKGILPFETTGTVGSTGLAVSAIRTTDGIVV